MVQSLLIANRGEIARRIMRTCRRLGIRAVAVYSDADASSPHVAEADTAVRIGASAAADSYLNMTALIDAAIRVGADAVHPGYGFLAESAAFARACGEEGLIFVGPPAAAIEAMGDKRAARRLAARLGVPVLTGYDGDDAGDEALAQAAARIGYPLMVKAAAGGGGKGMRLVSRPDDLAVALAAARREAAAAFGDGALLLERALLRPRHIEIQILADQHGHVIHLGERECSIQRRHQKVIEESPAPGLSEVLRAQMGTAAVALAAAVSYTGAGTVEFLLDENGSYAFLEMNTRLQVEHPVTELVTGLDLVEWQLRVAAGEPLPWAQDDIHANGCAIEARLYAEDPAAGFLPATGTVLLWRPPSGVRVDDGIASGSVISSYFDPLLAKIIAAGPTRTAALRRLERSLAETVLLGTTTNLAYLRAIVGHPAFSDPGRLSTRFLDESLPGWQPDNNPADMSLALIAVTLGRWQQLSAAGPGYWRNNPSEPAPFRYLLGEDAAEVRLWPVPWKKGHYHISTSTGAPPALVVLEAANGPELTLTIDDLRRRVAVAGSGNNWWAHTAGGAIRLRALPLLPEPQLPSNIRSSLRAPLPGTVLDVLVAAGQVVAEGQPLLKLEAMKMEHTIRAAAAGIVEAVYFAPGDRIEADALLASITTV